MEKFKAARNTLIAASLLGPLTLTGCKDSPEQTCGHLEDLDYALSNPGVDDWEDTEMLVSRLEDSIGERTDQAALDAQETVNMAEMWAASNGNINYQNTIDLTKQALKHCNPTPDA